MANGRPRPRSAKGNRDVLKPELAEEIIAAAREMFEASAPVADREELRRALDVVVREQARLADAIAAGADVPLLVARLNATERKRRDLEAQLHGHDKTVKRPAWSTIEQRVRKSLADWRSLIGGDVSDARDAFRQLLTTRSCARHLKKKIAVAFALRDGSDSTRCSVESW